MAAFGLLAAGIAHEVGNPLAGISSLIQMIRRRDPEPYTDEKLQLAESQLGRIQRTDPRAGRLLPPRVDRPGARPPRRGRRRGPGDRQVLPEDQGPGHHHRPPADLPPVRGIRDHLTQVILNLVLNAIDATGRGGRIRSRGARRGAVVLSVEDDGRGIAAEDQPRLFQPYFTTKPQGTGLGLFVSRQIVEEMGGDLSFRSEPGRGTTFRVRLPADRPDPALPAAPAPRRSAEPCHGQVAR